MGMRNLQEYLSLVKKQGLLKVVKTEVDPYLEITEIADRLVKSSAGSPVLFFENVKGSEFPVVINLFASKALMKLSLGVKDYKEISDSISELLVPEIPKGFIGKLKMVPKLAELAGIVPKIVKDAPCQEVTMSPLSLNRLPIMHCWPKDAGKFITLGLVITEEMESATRNVGMYRMQILEDKTTAMHWQAHKGGTKHWKKYREAGKRMPVAVALGCDPATIFSSICPLPEEIDEFLFAGFLRESPVELVKCRTIDIEVPAQAEFILEGYVEPDELIVEGPFGDHTGFYSLPDKFPIFHVTNITHRKNAIYPSTIVGIPPMEDAWIGKAIERIFLPMIKTALPEIVDMSFPPEGVFHNCVITSIKKRFPGHGKKVINALWGLGQLCYTRFIIVVPDHIDVQNYREVAWWVFNCFDPARSLVLSDGPLDDLDHASNNWRYGARMGLDATVPLPEEGRSRDWPQEIRMEQSVVKRVTDRWKEYGL